MTEVSLTRAERTEIIREAHDMRKREGGSIEDVRSLIEGRLSEMDRFSEVDYTDLSDYALSLAAFVCPHEAREL